MSVLDNAVKKNKDGGYDFTCPGVENSLCGDPATGATFTSTGWPERKHALARGRQHFEDHKGTVTPSLEEFRAEHGLGVNSDGKAVRLEDLS